MDSQSATGLHSTSPLRARFKLPDLSELLTPDRHKLELRMEGGGPMPYSLAVKYNALTPASDQGMQNDLTVKMAQAKLVEGAATEANVTVINKDKESGTESGGDRWSAGRT